MTLARLIPIAINASLALMVLGVGLSAAPNSIRAVLKQRRLLARSILAMNVIMPLIAAILALVADLRPALLAALLALAVSPVPPFLPGRELKAGGTPTYAVGLTAIAALLSIVLVPVTLELFQRLFHRELGIAPGTVAKVVLTSVVVPLVAGMLIQRFWPRLAGRLARPALLVATVLLVLAAIPLMMKVGPVMLRLVGGFTIVAIVGFVAIGLAVGHLLGGPNEDDRTVLALSTATRHPGVALAVMQVNAPGEPTIAAAILLYLVIGAVASTPYAKWRTRAHHAATTPRSRSGPAS